ncbi:spermidine/putrescine ABC transporter substrate-binding protein [uncultured Clostridium sp.]|uniref:ABC transporter substrate-binding protein n=1 Tax=uncultured Clostridium sp. TaxID=59620 RepID=UPI0025EBD660|nr:spermidine/putrescine ABC transporter substrate-binding protein [uncultured Clostridium sp.]
MKKSIRKKSKIIALLLCSIMAGSIFYGCKKEDKPTINFINYGENIGEGILDEFEEKYGIHVNQEVYDAPEEMYNKVTAGASQYDVVVSIDYLVQRMIAENRLEKIDFNNIPNMSKIAADHLGKTFDPENEYSVPYMSGTIGICYNTDYVKEPIDSWTALWDTQYQKNVVLLDGVRDSLGATLKMLGYSLNTTNPDEINEAKDKLIELKKNGNLLAIGSDDNTDKMANGEAAISILWSGEGLNLEAEYDNLKFIVPKEGANFWIDSLCIPKGTKNKENAEKFINFLCEKNPSFRTADEIGYTTPQSEAREEQDDLVKNNPNAYMPQELLDKCESYNYLGDKLKLYEEAWTEFKDYR